MKKNINKKIMPNPHQSKHKDFKVQKSLTSKKID